MFPAIAAGIGASLAGSAIASSGQTKAAKQAIQENKRTTNQAYSDSAPYRDLGNAAVAKIGDLLGLNTGFRNDQRYKDIYAKQLANFENAHQARFGKSIYSEDAGGGGAIPAEVQDKLNSLAEQEYQSLYGGETGGGPSVSEVMALDPGYQFRLDEGNKAITNRLGAMGLRNSGAALKGATRYSQDYASGEFDKIYSRLMGASGMGQNQVNTTNAMNMNSANTVGGYLTGAANSRGAAAISGANAINSGIGTVYNSMQQQDMLDKILNRGGYTGGGYTGYGVGGDYQYG